MAITKRNNYTPGQNLNNLSVNVDDNRLGNDQTEISVNFTTTPATITVKVGSVIEVNGNSYVIDTADETFQMSNASDNYITFTDNPSTAFGSSSNIGTFDPQKQGFYQAGNVIRTLRWYIDQAAQEYYIDLNISATIGKSAKLDNILSDDIEITNSLSANDADFVNVDATASLQIGNNSPFQFNNIRTVTGSRSGDGNIGISYPTGYSQGTTYVLSCRTSNGSTYYYTGQNNSVFGSGPNIAVQQSSSQIVVGLTNTGGSTYNIVLLIAR